MRVLAGLSPRRRSLALMLAVLAAVLVAIVVVRVVRSPAPANIDRSRPGPVLLVPGYGGSTGSLEVLAGHIRATGREAEVVRLPGDGTGDLAEQAATLQGAVAASLKDGASSVDLVGYSAGGVVVRLWAARYGDVRALRRVVTLGAPLHGTQLASAGQAAVPGACPLACQQLVPGSALLSELDAASLPPGVSWVSVWTRDDRTVTPPDSARLPGAVNVAVQDVCPNETVTHSGLPVDPAVIGLVLREIGTAPVTHPEPADCAALRSAGGNG